MELTVQLPFQQLLNLIQRLSPIEKETVRKVLSEETPQVKEKDSFMEFLLNGPVYSEAEIAVIEETRNSIAAWRTKS